MLLLFGFKTALKAMPGRAATCRHCGAFIHHLLEEQATKFTLFFIPVLTASRKYRITCTNCGYVSSITGRPLTGHSRTTGSNAPSLPRGTPAPPRW